MLLMKLKSEEKFAFLALAYHIAYIDGEFDKEEKDIIEEYCAEMGIDNIEYDIDNFNLEDVLKEIKTLKSQKIVLLELMILIHSDDKFHRFEHKVIENIANFYNISEHQLNLFSQWGKMSSAIYSQGKLFLEDDKKD